MSFEKLAQQFPLCYHPTSANRELSQLRADPSAAFLKENLTGVTHGSFLYQICGHDHSQHRSHKKKTNPKFSQADLNSCRATTAVIVPQPHGKDVENDIEHARIVAESYGAPVIIVKHEPHDTQNRLITIITITNGVESVIPNTDWDHLTRLMRSLQNTHEHLVHRCTVSLSQPTIPAAFIAPAVQAERDNTPEDAPEDYADLTVSAVARTVAGARHLDIDVSLACDECGAPIALIETSEKKNISAAMTIALANNLDVPAYRIRYSLNSLGEMTAKSTLYEYENEVASDLVARNNTTWHASATDPQSPRFNDIPIEDIAAELQRIVNEHHATHQVTTETNSTIAA